MVVLWWVRRKAWAGNGLVSEDHAAGWAACAGRCRGASADTWAGNGLVSEDYAVSRKTYAVL